MEALGFPLQREAELETLTLDVVKSSEIEGEKLNAEQVRSSIARRLGLDIAGAVPADRDVEGVVEMMLDATQNFDKPLTKDRLFGWHAALFPTGRSGMRKITVGAWRTDAEGPMQVVSGPPGKEKVHYEAPAAALLDGEMSRFVGWLNETDRTDLVLRAALAHLWFVTIHPFDDGNGRIARAIADWLLARSENSAQRFYSMSAQIRQERKAYYDILEKTQKGTLDITPWMEWFLGCLDRALDKTEATLATVLRKARFWERLAATAINERQRLVLNRMLEGFKGKLTSTNWAQIGKCSHDTALRDIQYLIDKDILVKNPAGGRSTSYSLKGIGG
jgi:Fic family protein